MVISINNLKIFTEVVNNGNNITLTSQKLYISQPAVSQAIKSIEDELHVQLFNRDKRKGMKLTSVGERILLHTRTLLYEEEKIYQIAHNENHLLEGVLKIAAIPLHTYPLIGRCIKIFKSHFPYVDIEYQEVTTKQVKEKVNQYEVDIGITIYPFDDFEVINLYDDSMIAFSKKDMKLKEFDFESVDQTVKVCQSGLEVIQPILEEKNLFRPQQFEIYSSPMTVKIFVDEGLGAGIVSQSFINNEKDYYIYPVKPLISSEVAIIFKRYNDLSPAAKEFIKIIYENRELSDEVKLRYNIHKEGDKDV